MRIMAVWSRALDSVEGCGRVNTSRNISAVFAQTGELTEVHHRNVLERDTRLPAVLHGAIVFALGLLTLRPLPLQCALFTPGQRERALVRHAAGCDVVFADGVRLLLWLRRLRRANRGLRIVVDLDDLMSRRCAELLAHRLPLSLGYVERRMPRGVVGALASARVAGFMLRYERWALRRAEGEILALADEVVLVNAAEAEQLGGCRRDARATVRVIPPLCVHPPAPRAAAAGGGAWRAVFVGSDALVQNRLTIDYLEALWQRYAIATPLVFYGARRRPRARVAHVEHRGHVADIAEAYAPGSILVCPSFLRGGIKTKVLEGFAHGVPVVGNGITFDGMRLGPYPLCLDDEGALVGLLRDPGAWTDVFDSARAVGRNYLAREHTPERFAARWRATVGAPTRPLADVTP